MRFSMAILAGVVSLGLCAGCAERPGTKKDDGKAKADGKKTKDAKTKDAKAK
jgi:hypothetical protein